RRRQAGGDVSARPRYGRSRTQHHRALLHGPALLRADRMPRGRGRMGPRRPDPRVLRRAAQGRRRGAATPVGMPLPEDFLELARAVNNWGRWGPDDEIGTLNLITDEVVRQAAGL